jgi:hypothetical protein
VGERCHAVGGRLCVDRETMSDELYGWVLSD